MNNPNYVESIIRGRTLGKQAVENINNSQFNPSLYFRGNQGQPLYRNAEKMWNWDKTMIYSPDQKSNGYLNILFDKSKLLKNK